MEHEKSFIEVQFPVSKISKESYKERKAGSNQTLTGLGKWWGRKPLILVRAVLLGVLMPASDNPKKDMEIFLKILSMDEEGLKLRKNKPIAIKDLFLMCNDKEKETYFQKADNEFIPKYKNGLTSKEKEKFQLNIFNRLSYDDKLKYSLRPEEIDDKKLNWKEINEHLNTDSTNIRDLIKELGIRKFGEVPKVGDCFCGGGSIPFEAARIGCDVYASDLNPLAGLLTWADLNILNKSNKEIMKLRQFQEKVYDEVVKQVDEWGIENNEKGWKAKYYLYCNEAICPECGCKVPLAPSWVISESFKTIAKPKYNKQNNNFDILIENNVSKEEIKKAKLSGTIVKGNLVCPHCNQSTPITALRKDRKNYDGTTSYGLRLWDKDEFIPRKDDVFQERLYAIKYIEKFDSKTWEDVMKKPAPATDACYGYVHYVTPTSEDLAREEKVINLINNRITDWQEKGYIPNTIIEDGYNTTQVIRERGWKYWHQLFNPRQLLLNGLIFEKASALSKNKQENIIALLGVNKLLDWNSKLSIWNTITCTGQNTFFNQALNPLYNFSVRGLSSLYTTWLFNLRNYEFKNTTNIKVRDARKVDNTCNVWITDPPYADAVNYHELSELFLAWDKTFLERTFPEWYVDSKRVLAAKGTGEEFNDSMIEIYSNLSTHMSDNGIQIIMFNHTDIEIWIDMLEIIRESGLYITNVYPIKTETRMKQNKNNYDCTILIICRKRDFEYLEINKEQLSTRVEDLTDEISDIILSETDKKIFKIAKTIKILSRYTLDTDIKDFFKD